MRRWCSLIAISLVLLLTSCVSLPVPWSTLDDESVCDQSAIDRLVSFGELSVPQHLSQTDSAKTGEEFDVSEYWTALTHLSMQQGYVLDYVYAWDSAAGRPVLYARPEAELPHRTYTDLILETGISDILELKQDYLRRVQADDTRQGFVELILLRIMGGQFYLWWHAGYLDTEVICDATRLEEIVSALPECKEDESYCLTRKQKRSALAIQVKPVVELRSDTVTVKVVTFSNWYGFVRQSYTIRRSFPHEPLKQSSRTLVPYDCGIVF